MVNVDMCRHEWPGSGCRYCREEASLDPTAEAIYNAAPLYRDVKEKIAWRSLTDSQQSHYRRLARAALGQ